MPFILFIFFKTQYFFCMQNGRTSRKISPLSISIFLSMMVHFLFFTNLPVLRPDQKVSDPQKKSYKIKTISKKELKNIRTRGVKDGEESFSLPSKQSSTLAASKKLPKKLEYFQDQPKEKKREKSRKTPNLSDLGIQKFSDSQFKREKKIKSPSTGLLPQRKSSSFQTKVELVPPPGSSLDLGNNNTQLTEGDIELFKQSDLFFNYRPPRGVPMDKLNSSEKIFYSFNRRFYIGYYNAFVRTYNQMGSEFPAFRYSLRRETVELRGSITFNEEGTVDSIRHLKSSSDPLIHRFFNNILQSIGPVPNIPGLLLEKEKQFTVYLSLNLNS